MDPRNCARTIVVMAAFASSVFAQTSGNRANRVTPVAGESWLMHLGRTFDDTSMGKTGRLGPASLETSEQDSGGASPLLSRAIARSAVLHGVDLYRVNCRGCHGEAGLGAPPEINSVINPVRAGSASLTMARMKKSGMSMSHAEAAMLAKQSQDALLQRLHNGGQDMPPFSHLDEVEIRALTAYLKQLAEIPGAESEQLAVTEPAVRVGEQIVKSTCHICHSASGENPDPEQLAEGAIPPLSALTSRVNPAQFVRKVTHGAPIVMGTPPLTCRGRMPVFYYLSEEEAADVYLYLSSYRPYQWATLNRVVATSQRSQGALEADPPQLVRAASFARGSQPAKSRPVNEAGDRQFVPWLIVAGVLVSLLLAGGCVFTIRECVRLSAEGKNEGKNDEFVPAATRVVVTDSGGDTEGDRLVA